MYIKVKCTQVGISNHGICVAETENRHLKSTVLEQADITEKNKTKQNRTHALPNAST